ncbi:MAG: DNA repair protein RecO [Chlamydiae bacterium]|nr:DNA repair protein RecO [Chlamydiota bacterium]
MTQELITDAFVLSSIAFKDYDRIVTLFSKEMGQIKLFVKGANRLKGNKFSLCEPLTYATYVLKKRRGDFYTFCEGRLLDSFLGLRNSYDHLTTAFDLLEAISKTQLDSTPSMDLFNLLKLYLKQLLTSSNPIALISSFYLKVLLLEGCLTLQSHCSRCHIKPSHLYFCFKDYFCQKCAPQKQLPFTSEELGYLLSIVKERSFIALSQQKISSDLKEKIRALYGQLSEINI